MKKQQPDIQEKWLALADKWRAEAKAIPAGHARDSLLRRISQLERAISLESLLRRDSATETSDPPDHRAWQHIR